MVIRTQNPFGFLWLANCILYSVVCAFLLMTGWKKQGPINEDKPKDRKNLRPGGREDQKTNVNRESGNRKVESKEEDHENKKGGEIGLSSKKNAKPSLWQVWLAAWRKKVGAPKVKTWV